MNQLLTIGELNTKQIQTILTLSEELSESNEPLLHGVNVGFVFEKPSLRTKVGTEAAINQLGGNVIEIDPDLLLANGKAVPFTCRESLKDAMMNVSQWCDAVFARVYSHATLEKMQQYGTIPVINALCNKHHPMQALADMLTIYGKFGSDNKAVITFIGDANNVAFSLTEIALILGHPVQFSGPTEYSWTNVQLQYFQLLAIQYGGEFIMIEDPYEAVRSSDVIYTDTFISMGEEYLYEEKIKHFESYQVNGKLFSTAPKTTGFMHCLPAHRGIEVTDEVIDHPNSWVYNQAKNRMIVSKAVFALILNPSFKQEFWPESMPVSESITVQ
ncbi:ornithine carbamoyltransferase [Gracilimonas sp.]|uniref:ornithine carbamoyltransferase n=1 Tax=Gracilimonas sp. TaxID=1974203 RepID=UPI002871E7D8|nr:ornithine carbamoyltransferase [Gracilimonas sp.]